MLIQNEATTPDQLLRQMNTPPGIDPYSMQNYQQIAEQPYLQPPEPQFDLKVKKVPSPDVETPEKEKIEVIPMNLEKPTGRISLDPTFVHFYLFFQ